jgi:hypothetical protein
MDNTINEPYTAGQGPGSAILGSSTTQDLTKIVSFMREDQDHIVFKRFERLNLYNLLCLQHRLTMVDKQIALHEDNHNVHALARVLSTLEPLMKSYSKLSPDAQISYLNGVLDEALLLHDRLRNLPCTTPRLASFLKEHSEHNLVELKHELDPEAGWSEVVSLSSTPKGWIHRFIDSHYQLRRLFRKVRSLCRFLGGLRWASVTCDPAKENVLIQT